MELFAGDRDYVELVRNALDDRDLSRRHSEPEEREFVRRAQLAARSHSSS